MLTVLTVLTVLVLQNSGGMVASLPDSPTKKRSAVKPKFKKKLTDEEVTLILFAIFIESCFLIE